MAVFLIGCGYNPNFQKGSLKIPACVNWLELGIKQFINWHNTSDNINLSLHIARSPITEEHDNQSVFISYLSSLVAQAKNSIKSIGFHLSGQRTKGLGRLGMTSHFDPSDEHVNKAINFITLMQKTFSSPIWIENANFYSKSYLEIANMWQAVSYICNVTNCGLIVDLSHFYIDLSNAGINPFQIFGIVPWEFVREIHISGVIKSHDGVYHDGHSQIISEEIWQLLHAVLLILCPQKHEFIITIEHTDFEWGQKQNEYLQDFSKLKDTITHSQEIIHKEQLIDSEYYARRHIYKNIQKKYPLLIDMMSRLKIDPFVEICAWIQARNEQGVRLTLDIHEIAPSERNSVVMLSDFITYIEKKYAVRD